MYFVYVHGRAIDILCLLLFHPLGVFPLVAGYVVYLWRRIRTSLHMIAVRIGLELYLSSWSLDTVFIIVKLLQSRDEKLPDTAVAYLVHIGRFTVPMVEIADNADLCRLGRPYSENYAFFSVLYREVRAEQLVSFRIFSLMEKVQRYFVFLRHIYSHIRCS